MRRNGEEKEKTREKTRSGNNGETRNQFETLANFTRFFRSETNFANQLGVKGKKRARRLLVR